MLSSMNFDPNSEEFFIAGERFVVFTPIESIQISWKIFAGESGKILAYKPESKRWVELTQTVKSHGYKFVSIAKVDGKYVQPYVHEIVLTAFSGSRPAGNMVVKHKNDDPDDNRLCNLEWGSRRENALDMHRNRSEERFSDLATNKVISFPIRKDILDKIRLNTKLKGKALEEPVSNFVFEA